MKVIFMCKSMSGHSVSNTMCKGIESVQFSIEWDRDGMQGSFRNVYTRIRHNIIIGGLLAQ